MGKMRCREMLLRMGVLWSALVCQSCMMGDLLFAGSGPGALRSIILLAKEPLQSHILVPHHFKVVSSHWMKREKEEGVQCSVSRCTGICRKLHLFTGAQVPTEDTHAWCEHGLLSPIPLLFRDSNTSGKLLLLARTEHLFSFSQCPWSASGSPCLCAHDNWFSNCLKIHLYRYPQKLKKNKEPRLSHSSAT